MIQTEPQKEDRFKMIKLTEKRLDASNSSSFRSAVLNSIDTFQETVILDLSEVQFLDSSGLGALIAILKTRNESSELILCGLSQNVERVFELTKMNKTFKVKASPEEAVSCINSK
jgi:anti-sigma B factor antagonist